MSRISDKFTDLRNNGRKGFIPFITAGDPDHSTSVKIALKLAEMGADVIELGVAFSDPVADGPTIQRSSQRALSAGTSLSKTLDLVREVRLTSDVPIVLFSYLNPLLAFGLDRLPGEAAEAGIDGLLVTDAVGSELERVGRPFRDSGLDLISLIAPTTTDTRLRSICSAATGFIYAVSRAGVTGASEKMSSDAQILVERARQFTDLPIAVGFGISTREQVENVWRYADAAVVGSAIVSEIERAVDEDDAVERVRSFVRALLPEFAKTRGEI